MFDFGYVPPSEARLKPREAALKALELDDTFAEAHAVLGVVRFLMDWDWEGAEAALLRAIEGRYIDEGETRVIVDGHWKGCECRVTIAAAVTQSLGP